MKAIAVLMLLILVSSGTLFAQRKSQVGMPSKGDEKIIARYSMASDSLYNMLVKQIGLYGYTIDRQVKDSLLIATDYRIVKVFLKYDMKLTIVDSTLTLSGTCIMGDLKIKFNNPPPAVPLRYGPKDYYPRAAFNEILTFIRGTNPVSIAYSK